MKKCRCQFSGYNLDKASQPQQFLYNSQQQQSSQAAKRPENADTKTAKLLVYKTLMVDATLAQEH